MKTAPTVALVEWNWMGHHPTFFVLFARALLDLGCTVLGLCPQPAEALAAIGPLEADARSRLTLLPLAWPRPPRFCPPGTRHLVLTTRAVHRMRRRIKQWETEHSRRIDLVFFACIYDAQFRLFRRARWLLPYPWSGLYLQSRAFRQPGTIIPQDGATPCPEAIFRRSPGLHSVAVLDEGAVDWLKRISDRPVVVFPDLTDEASDLTPTALGEKMKRVAAGSPIIASLGMLQPTKGIITLARLAADPANRDLCFAFVGEVIWHLFTSEEKALLVSIAERCPNVFTHYSRISDERCFNGVIQASDVVFAGYLNFPNSSGILTKAAIFRKPIIVSDGHLMAERVRGYRLGEVIPEGDVAAAGRAVRALVQEGSSWARRAQPDWDKYHRHHSYAALKESMANLLGLGGGNGG